SATAALAQLPQAGFFASKPVDDPSLSHTLAPEVYSAPAPAPAAPAAAPAPAATLVASPAPGAAAPVAAAAPPAPAPVENQMDRSEAEARQAAQAIAATPHINGAFNGLTDERDR